MPRGHGHLSLMGMGCDAHFVFLLPVCLKVSVVDTYSSLNQDKRLAAFKARGPRLKIGRGMQSEGLPFRCLSCPTRDVGAGWEGGFERNSGTVPGAG